MTSCSGTSRAVRAARLLFLPLFLVAAAAHAAAPSLAPISGQSVREGESIDIALSATDGDGDTITFTANNLPGFCTITDATGPDGNIQCNPGEFDSGNTNITVIATDNSVAAETDSENFVLMVTENNAPNLDNLSNQTVEEGGSLSIGLNASDPDTDGLSFSISGFPASCLLTDNGNGTGSVDCNPVNGDAGSYTAATVTVTDAAPFPLQDSDTITLTVTGNSAPSITPIADQLVREGASLGIPMTASDSDGDVLAWTPQAGLPAFCTFTDSSGTTANIDCTPGAGDATLTNVTVRVTDDGLIPEFDEDTFQLTVTANTPPNLTNITNQTVAEGSSINIGLTASDTDGDSVTFSTSNLPAFCLITDPTGPNGSIQCSPQAGDASVTIVTVRATDNGPIPEFSEDTFQLTVGANSAPVISPISAQSVEEGASLSFGFSAADANPGDTLSWSTTNLPGFCTLIDDSGNTGQISCNPGAGDANTYDVTITVTDDAPVPAQDSQVVALTVTANTAPVLSLIPNQSVGEGQNLNIALNASDDDGDNLTFSISGQPGFCSLTDSAGPTGQIQCSPGSGDSGDFNITVTVTDDAPVPANDSQPFQLTVTANVPPNLTAIPDQSTGEGVPLDIPLSATDPDGNDNGITYTASGQPGFCAFTDNSGPTGNLRCTPGNNNAGSWNITITATDSGPVAASSSDLFVLTVSANSPPVLTNIPNQSVGEGDIIDIPLSATDPDGNDNSITFSTSGLPGFCALTDNTGPGGNIQCSPQAGDDGNYNNITVTATDAGAVPASSSDQFSLSVSANSPPNISPIADQQTIEGATLNIAINASDPEGQNITFSTSGLPGFCNLSDATGPAGQISCSPSVGDDGSYSITVTATDDGGVPASSDEAFLLTVGANQAPTATNVAISGTLELGQVLTGSYTYNDAENDPQGTSTFRWLRDGVAIPGATATSYTVVEADIEAALVFEVTPVATTGATTGSPVQSAPVTVDNVAPSITGQATLETLEDTAIVVTLDDLTVTDADNDYPADFTIAAAAGGNYTAVPSADNKSLTITPALDFNGPLTVAITVNDGFASSPAFDLAITVTAVNDAPVITGLTAPLSIGEDEAITIALTDLQVSDPDNTYPTDFTLTLQPGTNYTLNGNQVIPDQDFNGQLSVPASVNDGELDSAIFNIIISVASVNDVPQVVTPIEDQQAVEDSPFNLNISGNFFDPEGNDLSYSVAWVPVKPPSISFNSNTGVFSGTPRAADANSPGPVYTATVTATDPAGDFVTDDFILTVSLRDRANLALSIDVAPETGGPGDDLRWTLTARNSVGPQPGRNVELIGSFVGAGLTVTAEGGATCTIQPPSGDTTEYVCQLGDLPVGGSNATVFTTTTSEVTEVLAFATAKGAQVDPVDPNLDDNSVELAAAVANAFSIGAVQIIGNDSILSLATGDVNNDGINDIVAGTVAGQNILVFPNDLPRESCNCQRDFLRSATVVTDSGAQTGIALADFDNNGTLDIVVVNGGGQPDRVYSNDGTGNFTPMATLGNSFGHDVAVADFNNDGNADIAIAAVGGNPIWHGDGAGGFNLHATLGSANSLGVAVAKFNADDRDDVVFANVGSPSRVWTKNSGGGFSSADQLNIGDAVAVAAGLLDGDQRPDLVFARVPSSVGDVPANPIMINTGNGTFPNAPLQLLGISPSNDVMIGDINGNGLNDIFIVNDSGVHQVWNSVGMSYSLYREHIIDSGAVAGVLGHLGDVANGDTGGIDLAMGGALSGGVAVYLNDGSGSLGRGDTEPPVITLSGLANVRIESGEVYRDSGATATDNIDGDITAEINVVNNVNTARVGTYTVTYNVTDFAGNAAETVTRTVAVDPAANSGGGGGSLSLWTVLALLGLVGAAANRRRRVRL